MLKKSHLAARIVVMIMYSMLFGELFLRTMQPQPLIPRYVTGDVDGVRQNMHDVTFLQSTAEVRVKIHYNSAGMRDDRPPPTLKKQPGECRIALLGDSFFVGFESDFSESFSRQLEFALRRSGAKCRVLNFAVSGFGTAEMLLALRARALKYSPDIVVMSWHSSDPQDNVRSGLYKLDRYGALIPTGREFLPGIATSDRLMQSVAYRWLIANSHLYSAIRERLGVFVKAQLAKARATSMNINPHHDSGRQLARAEVARPGSEALDVALLRAVNRTVIDSGAHLLIVGIPSPVSRYRFWSPFNWLPGEASSGLEEVDPVAAFTQAAAAGAKLFLERGEGHWTSAGNKIAADVAAQAIEDRGWLAVQHGAGAAGRENEPGRSLGT